MTLRFISRSEIEPAVWDDLVLSSPDGWIYSLHSWQDLTVAVAEWGFQDLGFGILDQDRLVAVVPLQYRPAHRAMASSGWGGSGPVIAGDLGEAERLAIFDAGYDECLAQAVAHGAERFDVQLAPVTDASRAVPPGSRPPGFERFDDRSGLSQLVDLSPSNEELWRGVAKNARWTIRKAREAGYQARQVSWPDYLDAYYETHIETYLRTGVTPHPKRYFEGIATRTAPLGHSALWAAFAADGRPVAFHNDAYFRSGAMYHTGCSAQQALTDGANYLLFWEAMIGAKKAGIAWFDCGAVFPDATGNKQAGLTTFKTRFGGTPGPLFRAETTFAQQAAEIVQPSTAPRSLRSNLLVGYRRVHRLIGVALGRT